MRFSSGRAWTRFWVGRCVPGTSKVWLLSKPRCGRFNGNKCVGVIALDAGVGLQLAMVVR